MVWDIIFRYRIEVQEDIASRIREAWICPDIAGLHWDEKLMDDLDNTYSKSERMPVLISGELHLLSFLQKFSVI